MAGHQDPGKIARRGLERLQEHVLNAAPILCEIDDFDLAGFCATAAAFGFERYAYVVTPNVDHLIRFCDEPSFRALYHAADYVVLDSRVVAVAVRLLRGQRLRVCPGSDLTAELLGRVAARADRIILVGGSAAQARQIGALYGLTDIQHHQPPMGFISDPQASENCLRFIEERSPFRFCFLAVGSPQQETIAQLLQSRGRARGLALCVGASLNFITGAERRAPHWMQQLALEWLHRLAMDPRRLARRYLVRGPRIFEQLLRGRLMLQVRCPPALPV